MAPNNLGKFAMLPFELRSQIWAELKPRNDTSKSDLRILRACSQLSKEITPFIYNNEILTFQISPVYHRKSWITVTNQLGAIWHLESSPHAISLGFASLPYGNLKGIKVEISAPDPADPGQVLNIRTKVCEFVHLLRSQDRELPDFDIHLNDTDSTSWIAQDGKPQLSIKDEGALDWMAPQDTDYTMILSPFCQLRRCRSAKIHAPKDIDLADGENDYRAPVEFFTFFMCLNIPFREFLDEEREAGASDPEMKQWLDEEFVDLDCALDHLPGQTAKWLRLERYAAWFDDGVFGRKSKYTDEWERITRTEEWEGFYSDEITHFRWRWRCMLAFNPCSAKMRTLREAESQFEPRHRFRNWNSSIFLWELTRKGTMYVKAILPRTRFGQQISGCLCCCDPESMSLSVRERFRKHFRIE
ncbi:hypothetical protein V8E51_001064 [Hyaloscypha variabilis]